MVEKRVAHVTWNGVSKTMRIANRTFGQNKTEVVDDGELIDYLKSSKGFTVSELVEAKPKQQTGPIEDNDVADELPSELPPVAIDDLEVPDPPKPPRRRGRRNSG